VSFHHVQRLTFGMLVLCLGVGPAAAAEAQETIDLRPLSPVGLINDTVPPDEAVLRTGLVAASLAPLADAGEGQRLVLEVFDDVTLAGVIDRRRAQSPQRFTLSGRIEGAVTGSFSLAVNREALAGVIRLHDGRAFRIRRGPGGLHVVEQLDLERLPVCTIEDNLPAPLAGGGGSGGGGEDCDDGSVIDVLVVYTPEAELQAGGVSAMEAEVDLMIEGMNVAFVNSQVGLQANLVFTWRIDIADSNVTLGRLTDPADGYMDGVHTLRDAYGADQVALVRSGGGGVANGLWNLDPESEATAFCINGLSSAPNAVVAHEIGHNLGCCHAVGDGGGCPPGGGLLFPYSNGHRFTGDSGTLWRTVMAYSPGIRIDHYSHPFILFDGEPTGIGNELPGANNALTIIQSKLTVSNWRCNDGICEALGLGSVEADCNGNEVPDPCDIALGTSLDIDGNGIPDECLPPCLTDINGDGATDVLDLIELLLCFAQPATPPCDTGQDVNGDGTVNVLDLIDLLLLFGTSCP
jgi:hypothetical protein